MVFDDVVLFVVVKARLSAVMMVIVVGSLNSDGECCLVKRVFCLMIGVFLKLLDYIVLLVFVG